MTLIVVFIKYNKLLNLKVLLNVMFITYNKYSLCLLNVNIYIYIYIKTHTFKRYLLHLLYVINITCNSIIKFSYLFNLINTIINIIERKIFIYILTKVFVNLHPLII